MFYIIIIGIKLKLLYSGKIILFFKIELVIFALELIIINYQQITKTTRLNYYFLQIILIT